MKHEINKNLIETDKDGFLSNPYEWVPAITEEMASVDGIQLSDAHWVIISFLRDYYDSYEVAPDLRTLSKLFERSPDSDTVNMAQLTTLFPFAPARTACRYAGLPKPVSGACV